MASVTSGDDEEHVHNNECQAIEVIGQDWSSEAVVLFLLDRELGRAALSCHVAMDLLCPEMRDACWVISESLGSLLSLWSQCHDVVVRNIHSKKSLSLTVDGL